MLHYDRKKTLSGRGAPLWLALDTIRRAYGAWFAIGALALVDAAWLAVSDMAIKPSSALVPALAIGLLMSVSRVYATRRPEPRLSCLARVSAESLAFGQVCTIFSYLLVTLQRPLLDDVLIASDRALGLDWPAMYAWVIKYPPLYAALAALYISPYVENILLHIYLNGRGDFARSRELLWLFIVTAFACVALSGPFPAAGAFISFNISSPESYVPQFLALHDGSMKLIDLGHITGLVQFPSFHCAAALVLTYAARGKGILFPFLCIFNFLVIVATPPIGGQHFADLWGGAGIAAAAILLMRALARKYTLYHPSHAGPGP